ncbi:ImmA/IrrE family metallo-endopeptidase [Streptomyces sp. B8F3]|uniref:ImmA/IrrE family metallo-endopeptidase n=1 Tax=Streptomyces sp. B8F3 TaxID=3153573 RepID=UPI00325DC7C6
MTPTHRHQQPSTRTARMHQPYDPWQAADTLGLTIRYAPLRDCLGCWVPPDRLIVLATRLTHVQERDTLAHEVEHALKHDTDCRYAGAAGRLWSRRQEARADEAAARKLIPTVDLEDALNWATSREEAAHELGVTEHMLRVRLLIRRRDLEWLDTSRTDG